jgi:hypothetical protein
MAETNSSIYPSFTSLDPVSSWRIILITSANSLRLIKPKINRLSQSNSFPIYLNDYNQLN